MWFVDVLLNAIALEDDDPLTLERQGAGAENSDNSSGGEEDEAAETSTTANTEVVKGSKAKAGESTIVTKKISATKNSMSQRGFVGSILSCCQCLASCCIFTYVLCPPVPSCVIRKVAFRPPKEVSYYLIVKDKNGKEKHVRSAKSASKYSTVQIQPILLDERKNYSEQLLRELMQPVDGFVVKSKSGNSLICAHFKPKYVNPGASKIFENKVAIFAQPNSSDLGHFLQPFVVSFPDLANSFMIDIYGFDYSGYGRSGGSPSEQNIYDDIESVFEEVVRRRGDQIEILLIGFSIGTTAVIDLASKRPNNLLGVVLIAPFTSGVRLLKNKPRDEKTSWYECFDNYSKISHVEVPVLVCHGTEDTMIPLLHGQVLHERAPQTVDPVIVEGATHVSILQARSVHWAIAMFAATKQLERNAQRSAFQAAIETLNPDQNESTAKETN